MRLIIDFLNAFNIHRKYVHEDSHHKKIIHKKRESESKMKENRSKQIGTNIRRIRNQRGYTVSTLASAIRKSPSAVSKYESGAISIDLETLYDVAEALHVQPDSLLVPITLEPEFSSSNEAPAFFSEHNLIYLYYYDGRTEEIHTSCLKLTGMKDQATFDVLLYMNLPESGDLNACEHFYVGTLYASDNVSSCALHNTQYSLERLSFFINNCYQDTRYKTGIMTGLSMSPLMPIVAKILVTTQPAENPLTLKEDLLISDEDIRRSRFFNMFCTI